MARERYQRQLKNINNEILDLAEKVEKLLQSAVNAMLSQDADMAGKIITEDDEIDESVRKIDRFCYDILLRQQPVASDLRIVSATMKILTDLERIGDYAVDISELTILMRSEKYPPIIEDIKKMSTEMLSILYQAIGAFSAIDMEGAKDVIKQDDLVDRLFIDIKRQIALGISEKNVDGELELDLLMIAKYFERVGDHATNIAEWVIFMKTGEFPNN